MPNRTPNVLYVDDDPGLTRLVQKAMQRRGFNFFSAGGVGEALSHLQRDDIDVVVLDHYMPDGTGLDILAGMGTLENRPSVVYVTAAAEMDIAVSAMKSGATDFVPKTGSEQFMELLLVAIDSAVDHVRMVRANERANREVHEARERAEMLLGEVNHRVANSLAMVAALVGLQANALEDLEAKRALSETQARIHAVAGVHRHLYTSGDVRTVQIGDYVSSLIGELENSVHAEGQTPRIRTHVQTFHVPTEKVASLGVILIELVTNAIKYAYEGLDPGEIRVSMSRHDDNVRLVIEDDGVGWSGTGKPRGTGLGTRIVKAMAHSLSAEVTYRGGPGTSVAVTFSLAG
jgi:two-component sensor histidine kinase